MPKNLKNRFDKLHHNAEWVGIREVKETTKQCIARNGQLDHYKTSLDHGFMVEALVDGHFAYCAAANTSDQALQEACDRATHLARTMASWKIFPCSSDHRPPATGQYESSVKVPLNKAIAGDIMGSLVRVTNKMKVSDKIINCMAQVFLVDQEISLVSSAGTRVSQQVSSVAYRLAATAQDGSETQTRTTGVPCYQGGLELLGQETLEKEAERVGNEVLELLKADPCPSGVYDLVLAPDQLYMQLHESIGHPLELDRILGDERNYAGWSFVQISDFGRLQYGSSLLNVTFDPTLAGEYASYAFDDTGLPAARQYLIKEGLLLRGLGGIDSQKRAGLPGVACTRATSWNRPPIDRMANINIEPGNTSLAEMIAGVEKGIYMTTNTSWSIDDYRRKFQFGCEYAKLIEDGKFTKTLKNPNYRGQTSAFWKSLKKVGDSSTFEIWGSPFCGKGEPNQMIGVGHAVPACLFEKVDVFGGAL